MTTTGKELSQTERWRVRQLHSTPRRARREVGKSDPTKQTHTPSDRTADMLDSATTGQCSAGKGGNWPGSAVTINLSVSQGQQQSRQRCSGCAGWSKSVLMIRGADFQEKLVGQNVTS